MKNNITLITIVLLIGSAFPLASLAQAGSLDFSFDTDGKVITPIGNSTDYAQAMALQPDGKIVVAGFSFIGSNYIFAVVRYNTNGSLDNTFDTDGKVTTHIGIANDAAYAVAIQPDGKIVVAGNSYNSTSNDDFAVVRYNTNGSLDNSFDTDGIVTTAIGPDGDFAKSIAIQPDGKIVVAGHSDDGLSDDFALVRYNSNGSLDNNFDTDGIVTTGFDPFGDDGYAVAIQTDGKIVVAGESWGGMYNNIALARYNTNGSLDNTFDTDGKVITLVGASNAIGNSLAIQSDGKILVAGESNNGSNKVFALVRYNTNGSLDNTFDTDGKVSTAIGTNDDRGYAIAIQSDGKIVVAGESKNGTNYDFALVRYNTNGSLDNTFDTDGKVTTDIGSSDDKSFSIVIQGDGKILVAGVSKNDFALARYNSTGNVGIQETVILNTVIQIYPNPFSTFTTLKSNHFLIEASVTVYNIYGQEVKQINNLSGQTITLSRDNLPDGNYFIMLTEGNKIISKYKLLIGH